LQPWNYLNALDTDVNMPLTCVPRAMTVATIAKAIPDAMSAYSITVAAL
jgi:hypothetical protein